MSRENDGDVAEAPTPDDQVARIFAWRRGFNAMHLIDIGVRLGLFEAIAAEPGIGSEALAERLSLHAPYVETWCVTAYSFALLETDGEERAWQLAPHMDQILAKPGHPRYLGDFVRLGTDHATEDHRFCREAFRDGATVPFQGRSEAFGLAVAGATAGLQVLSARKLLPELDGLKDRLDGGGSVLEVGCGMGRHLLQITKAFPEAKCVGIDIDPTGMTAARETIAKAGLEDRVVLIEGDVATAVAESSADAVVMVEVLHEIGQGIRQSVIDACHRALAPGGWLLIIDETYPTSLADSREADFLFPVQTGFEELTWGNIVPTREEQDTLLSTAGFSGDIQRSIIGEGFTVLAARK